MKIFLKLLFFAAVVVVLVLLFTDSIDTKTNQENMGVEADGPLIEDPISDDGDDSISQIDESDQNENTDEDDGSVVLGGDGFLGGLKPTTFRYTVDGFDFSEHTVRVDNQIFFNNITDESVTIVSDDYDGLNIELAAGAFDTVLFDEVGEFYFSASDNPEQKSKVIVVEEF